MRIDESDRNNDVREEYGGVKLRMRMRELKGVKVRAFRKETR